MNHSFRHADDLLWRRVDEGILVVQRSLRVDQPMALLEGPVAALLWTTLREGAWLKDAAGAVTARFEVADDLARADAEAFVATLAAESLLVPAEDVAPAPPRASAGPREPYQPPRHQRIDLPELVNAPPYVSAMSACGCGCGGGCPTIQPL